MIPGWYEDPDDPELARWHDGHRMTEHTLVIADQPPGRTPPPPSLAPSGWAVAGAGGPDPEPTADAPAVAAERRTEDDIADDPSLDWSPEHMVVAQPRHGRVRHHRPRPSEDEWRRRPLDALRALPWSNFALPAAVVAALLVAVLAWQVASGDDPATEVATDASTDDGSATLEEAAQEALDATDVALFTPEGLETLIERACRAAARDDPASLARQVQLLRYDAAQIEELFVALDVGTQARCPEDMAAEPGMLDEVQAAVLTPPDFSTATTTTTTLPDSTTSSTRATATTRRTTTTTAPAATTPPTETTTTTSSTTTTSTTTPPSSTVPTPPVSTA